MAILRPRKFTIKVLLVYILFVILFVFARPEPRLYFLAGLTLLFMGEAIRLWATGFLEKNKVLVKDGPYAYVKNPLYIGSFFIMTGFCIMAKGDFYINWIILGIGILFFVFYYAPYKKKREGARLRKIFGSEWDEYEKTVPDYIPRLKPIGNSSNHWSLKRVIENSEHWTFATIIVGSIIIYFNRPVIQFINGRF